MEEIRLIETQDGSHSLYVPELNETYHSFRGAIQESQHVFIRMGLHYYLDLHRTNKVKILEIGFGTGLNALLTFKDITRKKIKGWYDTIEPFPIDEAIWSKLNYVEQLEMLEEKEVYEQLNQHCIKTEQGDKFLPYLTCFLKAGDGETCLTEIGIDKRLFFMD